MCMTLLALPLLLPVSLNVSFITSALALGPVGWHLGHSHLVPMRPVCVSGQGSMGLKVPPPGLVLGTTWAPQEPQAQSRRSGRVPEQGPSSQGQSHWDWGPNTYQVERCILRPD